MRYWIKLIGIVAFLFGVNTAYAIDAADEFSIKAAFFYNLGNFVNWKAESVDDSQNNFVLCILGQDPFGERLDIIVGKNKVKNRPISIRRLKKVEEAQACHTLFISASEESDIDTIFVWLKNKPILTVSDMPNFIVNGGMVMFFKKKNNIRLALAPAAFADANLQATTKLIRVAEKLIEKK